MTKEDHAFLHDMMNKLAKVEGFASMLKVQVGEDNPQLQKIEKSNSEAIALLKNYRALLESGTNNR